MAKDHDQKVTLTFIINGENVAIDANVHAPLTAAASKALEQSGNTSRDLSQWELRDVNGTRLELGRKVGDYAFPDGTKLFLTLAVGVGGHW